MRKAILMMALVTAVGFSFDTYAAECPMLSYAIDDARTKLKRARQADSLDEAKDYARRAKSALSDASMAVMNCDCLMAQMEFDSAETKARRASNSDNGQEFVDNLNRAIKDFNNALDALRMCSR